MIETSNGDTEQDTNTDAAGKDLQSGRDELAEIITKGILDSAPGLPKNYVLPRGYAITTDAVTYTANNNKGEPVTREIATAPLVLVRLLIDPAEEQICELAWARAGRWTVRQVSRSVMLSGRKLFAALADVGLPINEGDAGGVERYLARLERANYHLLERVRIVRRLGWQPDGAFAIGPDQPFPVTPAISTQVGFIEAHRARGDFQTWKDAVNLLAPYPTAQMGLFAAFAATLLNLLSIDSFTIDFSGLSSRGKSTTARAAASVFTCPLDAKGITQWSITPTAAEARFNAVEGLPVVLDDSQLARIPEELSKLLYQIPMNAGRPRSSGWQSELPWRVLVISTGERSLLSFTKEQGVSARVLAIETPPLGPDSPDAAEAATRLRELVFEHHGLAGPMFVGKLQLLLAKTFDGGQTGLEWLKEKHAALTEPHRFGNEISRRRAPLVGVLRLAAQLAHHWDILPFPPPDEAVWKTVFSNLSTRDDRPGEALELVRQHVSARSTHLWRPRSTDYQPTSGWIGRTLVHQGHHIVALYPDVVRRLLRERDIELDTVLPAWRERGCLIENPGDKAQPWTINRRIAGMSSRLMAFAPDVIDLSGSDDAEDGTS